jgi:hypothetical protein
MLTDSSVHFATKFASMSDDEILGFGINVESLPSEGKQALLTEIERRRQRLAAAGGAEANSSNSTAKLVGPSPHAGQVMSRYRDGYFYARALDTLGALIQAVGFVLGGLVVMAGCFELSNAKDSPLSTLMPVGFLTIVSGVGLVGSSYVWGVILKASGQFLKAHFDSAVCLSPFLNDDQRAEVMSLR